jgi:hypothetical protein
MLTRSRFAFVSGGLSVAVLWGLTGLVPAASSPRGSRPAAERGVAATKSRSADIPVLHHQDFVAPGPTASAIAATELDRLHLTRSEPFEPSSPSPQSWIQPAVPPTSRNADAPSSGSSSAEHAAVTLRSGASAGTVGDAIVESWFRGGSIPTRQEPAPAEQTVGAARPLAQPAVAATPPGPPLPAPAAPSAPAPPVTPPVASGPPPASTPGSVTGEPFVDDTPDFTLGGSIGGGSGGGTERIWEPASMLAGDLPGANASTPPGLVVANETAAAFTGENGNATRDVATAANASGVDHSNAPDFAAGPKIVDLGARTRSDSPAAALLPMLQIAVVPEPGTASLLASGVVGLAILRRRASADSRRG